MHKRLIIFGAGRNGDDAYHFFGRENILCFVDNNEKMVGTKLHDKKIISFNELKELKEKLEIKDLCSDNLLRNEILKKYK